MITLYGTQKSRALRVSWLLEELGVEWQFHAIDFAKGENKHSAKFYRILNEVPTVLMVAIVVIAVMKPF